MSATKLIVYGSILLAGGATLARDACSGITNADAAEQDGKIEKDSTLRDTELFRADPADHYRQFCRRFTNRLRSLPRVAGYQYWINSRMESRKGEYRIRFDSTYEIDVRKTSSMISPYIGTLQVGGNLLWDNGQLGRRRRYLFTFAAQHEKWVLQKMETMDKGSWTDLDPFGARFLDQLHK